MAGNDAPEGSLNQTNVTRTSKRPNSCSICSTPKQVRSDNQSRSSTQARWSSNSSFSAFHAFTHDPSAQLEQVFQQHDDFDKLVEGRKVTGNNAFAPLCSVVQALSDADGEKTAQLLNALRSLLANHPDMTLAVVDNVQEAYRKEKDDTVALLEICEKGELGFYDATKHWGEDEFRDKWQSAARDSGYASRTISMVHPPNGEAIYPMALSLEGNSTTPQEELTTSSGCTKASNEKLQSLTPLTNTASVDGQWICWYCKDERKKSKRFAWSGNHDWMRHMKAHDKELMAACEHSGCTAKPKKRGYKHHHNSAHSDCENEECSLYREYYSDTTWKACVCINEHKPDKPIAFASDNCWEEFLRHLMDDHEDLVKNCNLKWAKDEDDPHKAIIALTTARWDLKSQVQERGSTITSNMSNSFLSETDPHALLRELQHSPSTPALVSQLAEYLHIRQYKDNQNDIRSRHEFFRHSMDNLDITARPQHAVQPQNPVYSISHQIETSPNFSVSQSRFEQESNALRQHLPTQLGVMSDHNPYSQSHLQYPVQPNLGQMEEAAMSWGKSTTDIDNYERMSPLMSRTTKEIDLEGSANTLIHVGAIDEGCISGEIALPCQYQSPSIHSQSNYVRPHCHLNDPQSMQYNVFATPGSRDTICELIDDYALILQNQQRGALGDNARRTLYSTMTSQGQHKDPISATSTVHSNKCFQPM